MLAQCCLTEEGGRAVGLPRAAGPRLPPHLLRQAHISGNSFCKTDWWRSVGGTLWGPPFVQVLPGVASGTFMPELVMVTEEDPGWKPELSGRQNQGSAADVQVALCRNPPLPAGDLDREAPVSILVYLSEVYIIHV